MINVRQMYNYARDNQLKLLSNYNSAFWNYYTSNNTFFDSLLSRRFKSFVFFDQEENDEVDIVTNNFISAVYEWLLVNDKRYSELYRPYTLTDEDYKLLRDYNVTIIHNGTNNHSGSVMLGQRTDVDINSIGSQEFSELNKIVPYNSNNEKLCEQISIEDVQKSITVTEVLILNNFKETDKIINLEIYDNNAKIITTLVINIDEKTVEVQGEKEALQKISEIELKEFLGFAAGLSNKKAHINITDDELKLQLQLNC